MTPAASTSRIFLQRLSNAASISSSSSPSSCVGSSSSKNCSYGLLSLNNFTRALSCVAGGRGGFDFTRVNSSNNNSNTSSLYGSGSLSNVIIRRNMSNLLTLDNINPNVIKMEYAVRGPLVIRAGEIEKELKSVSNLSCVFNKYANVGTYLIR